MNQTPILFSSEALAHVAEMARLQDQFNRVLFPDWEVRRLAWTRAIWMECAEMMERVHWKWWKSSQSPEDLPQQRIELVDIWHFILSDALQAGGTPEEIIEPFLLGWRGQSVKNLLAPATVDGAQSRSNLIERLATEALAAQLEIPHFGGRALIQTFGELCRAYSLPLQDLFRLYVGKNALNQFRNENGYKSGGYRKHWSDQREDNAHLEDVMVLAANQAVEPGRLISFVKESLLARYHATQA